MNMTPEWEDRYQGEGRPPKSKQPPFPEEPDASTNKIELGEEAQEEARQVFKNFYASNQDQLNEQTIGYYINQFMEIINGGK